MLRFQWVAFILFAAIGLFTLGLNLFGLITSANWFSTPFGGFWYQADAASLNFTQAITQRYISPDLWEAFIPVLEAPAWLVLLIPAIIFTALALLMRPRRQTS